MHTYTSLEEVKGRNAGYEGMLGKEKKVFCGTVFTLCCSFQTFSCVVEGVEGTFLLSHKLQE